MTAICYNMKVTATCERCGKVCELNNPYSIQLPNIDYGYGGALLENVRIAYVMHNTKNECTPKRRPIDETKPNPDSQ